MDLRIGMKGREIKSLQKKLIIIGFLKKGQDDGDFGGITNKAIMAFQKKYRLRIDGIVGKNTKIILDQLVKAEIQEARKSKVKPKPVVKPKYLVPKIKPAPRKVKGNGLKKEDIKYGILHHTAFKGDMTWEQIDKEHREKFDTDGFGYHFKIMKNGTIQAGRPLSRQGGATIGVQCKGLNSVSIGIVWDGNFEEEKLTKEQIESGKILLKWLKYVVYKGKLQFIGHKDAHNITKEANITACPGKNFPLEMFKKL